MKILHVKNNVFKECRNWAITQNAWLYLFPNIILFPTLLEEEGKFRSLAGI